MDSWARADPETTISRSFANLFSILQLPPPPDNTNTTTTKQPTSLIPAEVEISGPSFHSLQKMDVSQFELSKEHTFEWACKLLEDYGPSPQARYDDFWDPIKMNHRVPRRIFSECDARMYFKTCVLEPALSAAIFLHAQHESLTASQSGGYPRYKWDVRDVRSDRSECAMMLTCFETCDEPVIIAEGRASSVCSSGDTADVIEKLPDWFEELGGVIPMGTPGSSLATGTADSVNIYDTSWKQRLQAFFFETWHQLVTKKCQYSIMFNENRFLLCYWIDNSIYVSEPYPTAPLVSAPREHPLIYLAYFLATAMCQRLPEGVMKVVSQNTREADALSAPQVPSRLILTTSGVASSPYPLTALHPNASTSKLCSPLIVLNSIKHYGSCFYIFRGHSDGTSIIGKLALEGSRLDLQAEFSVYQRLSTLQGSVVPRCFGLFDVQHLGLLLLLEDYGRSTGSFDELSNTQKALLINHISAIHQWGIIHDYLKPRNVAVSASGNVAIIGFDESDQNHRCKGIKCDELAGLRHELERLGQV